MEKVTDNAAENATAEETAAAAEAVSDNTAAVPAKKRSLYWRILAVVCCIIVVFFLLSFWKDIDDWYAEHIYPHLQYVFAHVTNLSPVAIGELLMYLAAIILIITVVRSVICAVRAIRHKVKGREYPNGFRAYRRWMKFSLVVVVAVLWLYLFQWWIPFRGHVLGEEEHLTQFTLEELKYARNTMLVTMNEACLAQPRDAEGHVVYGDKEEIYGIVVEAMRKVSGEYPLLAGYYANPKEALCSDFFEWMSIGGYTYPYTMEITVNRYISRRYFYVLSCHEAAHNKGYFKENEAEFIAFRCSLASDDPRMICEGCYNYFWDVDEALRIALIKQYGVAEGQMWYERLPQPVPQLFDDSFDAAQEAEEMYQAEEHPLENQFAETAADVAEVGWETQDELLAENSYSGVTSLIIEYYAKQYREMKAGTE